MGNILFNRFASITIGPAGNIGTKIEGLHMTFKIEKTIGASSNKGKISVFNLSDSTRALLNQENARVIIEAGTGRSTGIIFSGDVLSANTKRAGANLVTDIDAADGHVAINAVNVDRTYPVGTDYRSIMEDLAGEMVRGGSVAIGAIAPISGKTQGGFSVTGSAGKALTRIAEENGLLASVQDGEIQVIEKAAGQSQEAVVLSSETGLVETPQEGKEVVKVTSLILGAALNPGRKIKVLAAKLSGIYVIQKAIIDGSVFGGPWLTRMEVV